MSVFKFIEYKDFQVRFNFIRDFFIVIGVFFAAGSMIYAGTQVALMKQQVEGSRKVNSATFVTNINNYLNSDRYDNISTAIEGNDTIHTSSYPILKKSGGQFNNGDIDDFIGNYETVADLWQDGLVDERMAYDEFSYDTEKTWCNNDIRNYIMNERKADKNYVGYKAFYSGFEKMSKHFLSIDGKSCSDLDKE